ncbi:alanyl-tRNA synthetase [Evansella vedderi]|uniref:Alanyl-tRNA synthetase n=1 Tax=Evansella vedderi TaxID=38282 RepID=A0ABT9ZV36_9BACI|nr:DHHA1 domain-containing protein [Evansella vedderi]MDQ0255107.1 alanyl-tRNA synthetase [Evansella vedderi]
MENKLYYLDPYIKEFQTKVLRCEEDSNGTYVVLQETAFYPTGGGQPNDTGSLNGYVVTNVEDVDGEVRHYINETIVEGEDVTGKINWERRFDHMQQHTGQHILSAAFVELFQFQTLSFHLGTETSTIDIDTSEVTEDELRKAEERANEIILENRSIETKWIRESEVNEYPLRKAPTVRDNIRLVIIPDYDYNACGGTHPTSTGEVVALKIFQWERQNKKVRIHFVCGSRVLQHLHEKNKVLMEISQLLSTPPEKAGEAVHRLLATNKELEKELQNNQRILMDVEGDALLRKSIEWNGQKLVFEEFKDRSMKELQKFAKLVVEKDGQGVVVLVSENGEQLQLVCGRGNGADINMKELIGELLPLINGRGGGTPAFAQGGGEALISSKELVEHAKKFIVK